MTMLQEYLETAFNTFLQFLALLPMIGSVAVFVLAIFYPAILTGLFMPFYLIYRVLSSIPQSIFALAIYPLMAVMFAHPEYGYTGNAPFMLLASCHMVISLCLIGTESLFFSPLLWLLIVSHLIYGAQSPTFHCYNYLLFLVGWLICYQTAFSILFPPLSGVLLCISLFHTQQDPKNEVWLFSFAIVTTIGHILATFLDPGVYFLTSTACYFLLAQLDTQTCDAYKHSLSLLTLSFAAYVPLFAFPASWQYIPIAQTLLGTYLEAKPGVDSFMQTVDSIRRTSYNNSGDGHHDSKANPARNG